MIKPKLDKIEEGTVLSISVAPNSENFEISGIDEWGQELRIRCKEKALEGRANKEIQKELEKLFGSETRIVSGAKSKHKKVLVKLTEKEILNKLGL